MSDENHLVASDNYYSFIRTETGLIQTHFDYNQILNSNYIAFQNYDYSNKWFFAFIDEVIFKGPANTEIRFTIDPFSTFNKDLNYGNSYVIREHVNDDTIGANTVPENLETGEMIQEGDTLFITDLGVSYWVAVETDCHPLGESVINPNDPQIVKFGGISIFNKLISGHEILVFKTSGDLGRFIERMGKDDVADSIKSMFIVPTAMFNNVTLLSNLPMMLRHLQIDLIFMEFLIQIMYQNLMLQFQKVIHLQDIVLKIINVKYIHIIIYIFLIMWGKIKY